MNSPDARPKLSVIVVCHEMAAQIENTLRSFLPSYQRGIALDDYEIILMDNGSAEMLAEGVQKLSPNLRYEYVSPQEAKPSPAGALNRGAAAARAPWLCLMIDGARMITPGVFSWAMRLLELSPNSIVEVRGWHLGPKFQPESVAEGYNHEIETALLEKVRWWENGYRLFEIAAASAQTRHGLTQPASESNCLFLSRELFDRMGGFDERYAEAGGGLVNLDFYARAVAAADHAWTLLGEGNFHQVHGGAATSLSPDKLGRAGVRWRAESNRLRGPLPSIEAKRFIVAGHMPPEFQSWLQRWHGSPTS
ncbi:MAG: glycosyltransferase family 2 protein [Chthoniobacterales bacterium]|nr:glycosyltransferase family 2 protein [Chthoniobacterales bacterium]